MSDELLSNVSSRRRKTSRVVSVSDVVEALVLDLLEWIGAVSRCYADVVDAWRTSCPRLPVWEEGNDRGFVQRHHLPGRGERIAVSAAGEEHLRKHRQPLFLRPERNGQ
jgi:hypothetical protein